jgi:hypothetical protein
MRLVTILTSFAYVGASFHSFRSSTTETSTVKDGHSETIVHSHSQTQDGDRTNTRKFDEILHDGTGKATEEICDGDQCTRREIPVSGGVLERSLSVSQPKNSAMSGPAVRGTQASMK